MKTFGVTEAGELMVSPGHEPELSVFTIGGRGRLKWHPPTPMPLEIALALRIRLQEALAKLESQIQEAGGTVEG